MIVRKRNSGLWQKPFFLTYERRTHEGDFERLSSLTTPVLSSHIVLFWDDSAIRKDHYWRITPSGEHSGGCGAILKKPIFLSVSHE